MTVDQRGDLHTVIKDDTANEATQEATAVSITCLIVFDISRFKGGDLGRTAELESLETTTIPEKACPLDGIIASK